MTHRWRRPRPKRTRTRDQHEDWLRRTQRKRNARRADYEQQPDLTDLDETETEQP